MGRAEDHLARARSNEALAGRLEAEGEFAWAITVLFYSSVHYVGALLTRVGIDTAALDHITTEAKLDKHYTAIARRHMSLRGMSERARYLPSHEPDAAVVRRAKQNLAAISDYTRRALAGQIPGV